MLRFLFLRFLPRRLMPLLLLLEIYRLFRRWQARNGPHIDPSPRALSGNDGDGSPRYLVDRGA